MLLGELFFLLDHRCDIAQRKAESKGKGQQPEPYCPGDVPKKLHKKWPRSKAGRQEQNYHHVPAFCVRFYFKSKNKICQYSPRTTAGVIVRYTFYMKILYLITKSNWGGAQRYVYDLAAGAKAAKHDIVVGFGGNGMLDERLRAAGIRTISVPALERDVRAWKDIRSFGAVWKILRAEMPDVLHLNSSKVGGLGALAGRIHNLAGGKTRIIFTGHGWAFTEERPDWQRIMIATLHWITIQLSHATIAVSKKTREEVARIPFTWHAMVVIHNGIGATALLPREEARKALGIPCDDTLTIGTIGELHRNKGHAYVLDGLTTLKKQTNTPFRFVVLGDGEERLALEYQRSKLDLDNEVFFPGFRANATEMLSAFDIFLFPSVKEGFPYAVLEAGKAGLPVVASAVGGIPEIIDDMESGILIQSKNPGEIARALKYLIDHPDRRRDLGVKLAERIRDKFSVEEMVTKTLQLYGANKE